MWKHIASLRGKLTASCGVDAHVMVWDVARRLCIQYRLSCTDNNKHVLNCQNVLQIVNDIQVFYSIMGAFLQEDKYILNIRL